MSVQTLPRRCYLSIGHGVENDIAWAYLSDSSYIESVHGEQNSFHSDVFQYASEEGLRVLASGRISPETKTGSISINTRIDTTKKIIEFMVDKTVGEIKFFIFTSDGRYDGVSIQDFYDQNY